MTTKPTRWVIVRDRTTPPLVKEYYDPEGEYWSDENENACEFSTERIATEVNESLGLGGRVEKVEGKS